jgi:hypothetical protein
MVYDWNGRRTRRMQLMRLATAIAVGLALPLAIAAWPYVR